MKTELLEDGTLELKPDMWNAEDFIPMVQLIMRLRDLAAEGKTVSKIRMPRYAAIYGIPVEYTPCLSLRGMKPETHDTRF